MAHLSDRELQAIIAWGRRAVAAAQAGEKTPPPTEEEGQALARWQTFCEAIRDGYL
jgi:hypothetical protein